jgi:hypothetical protein
MPETVEKLPDGGEIIIFEAAKSLRINNLPDFSEGLNFWHVISLYHQQGRNN